MPLEALPGRGLLGSDEFVTTPDGRRLRDLPRLAADLSTVIGAFPHRRLVLVGHSWGGPVVRVVASQRRVNGMSIDGLVLVDQSDENSRLYFSRAAQLQVAVQAACGRTGRRPPSTVEHALCPPKNQVTWSPSQSRS